MKRIDYMDPIPELHFSRSLRRWEGKPFAQLAHDLEALRVGAKIGIDYFWDNSNFFINDAYGHPALNFSIYIEKDGTGVMSMWNARNGCAIKRAIKGAVWTSEMSRQITEIADNIAQGLTQCDECGDWFKETISFSFAGAVCKECYDPAKHRPPNTQGD